MAARNGAGTVVTPPAGPAAGEAHCWTDKHAWVVDTFGWASETHLAMLDEPSATCMLWGGHDGAHEWTSDDKIVVEFLPIGRKRVTARLRDYVKRRRRT